MFMRKTNRLYGSIRFKVLLVFAVFVVATFSASFLYFRQYTYQTSMERYQEQLSPLRSALKNNLETYITTCVQAVRSVYYNNSTIRLITNKDANFSNAETEDSQNLFSFLLSIYASLPSSQQIHLSAYTVDRSFLITTNDLVRYVEGRPGSSFMADYPTQSLSNLQNSIWVEGSHPMHHYNHFVSPYTKSGEPVFTVHVPIFMIPNYTKVVGLVSVDISNQYIDENCKYICQMGADVYISDPDGKLVYADDSSLLGQDVGQIQGLSGLSAEELNRIEDYRIANGQLITSNVINTSYCKWQIHTVTPVSSITHDMTKLQLQLFTFFLSVLLALALLMTLILFRYTRPLTQIAAFMHANFYHKNYNVKARLAEHISYHAQDEISVLIENIDAMLNTVDRYVVREYQLLLAQRTAELRTLQAQINPHFIYNTLQCIASKTLEKGDVQSYDYIASFGQLLQYSMDVDESIVPLMREIEHMRRYLDLQAIRFESTVECEVDVPLEILGMMIPKMTLQPFAENSLLHGKLWQKPDGKIIVRAYEEKGFYVIEVIDNGVAITAKEQEQQKLKVQRLRRDYERLKTASPERMAQDDRPLAQESEKELLEQTVEAHHGAHIGVTNVFIRSLLRFGSRSDFEMKANDLGGTTVRLIIAKERVKMVPAGQRGGEPSYETADC